MLIKTHVWEKVINAGLESTSTKRHHKNDDNCQWPDSSTSQQRVRIWTNKREPME
jgi:hypothetical protein